MAPPEKPGASPGADLGLVALLSAAIFTFAHWQGLINPYVINDDIRQQIFWMQQWQDPELFRGDLLSEYARAYVSWGLKGLYWLASWVVGPLTFSKLLPGILFVWLSVCLYKIGETMGGRRLAWMTAAVSWLTPFFLDNLAGGLARAFAAPLLAWFWLSWLTRNPRGMALALLLQALIIPYIFPGCAGAAVLAWAVSRVRGRSAPPPFPARLSHLAWVVLGAGLVLLFSGHLQTVGYGPLVSAAEMADRPEYYAGGRYTFFPIPSLIELFLSTWEGFAPFNELGVWGSVLGGALLLGFLLYAGLRVDWRALRPQLQPVAYLSVASVALYFLARLVYVRLFPPDRYVIYPLNLFYCLGLALCLKSTLRVDRWPRRFMPLALALAVVAGGLRLQGVGLYDFSAYQPLYAALAQTPKDALIAGHPNLMDNALTFGRRRAFATFELAHVWSRGYWQQIRPRLEELFTAYYAEDPEVVRAFCRRRGIAFLVVDDRHFTPAFLKGGRLYVPFDDTSGRKPYRLAEGVQCPFFAPFDEQIRIMTQGRRRFALLDPKAFPGRTIGEHLRLLDLRTPASTQTQAGP
jgi:hypothetical protein